MFRSIRPTFLTFRRFASTEIASYGEFISEVSARRRPSAIRAIQPLTKIPGMISLGGGYPNGSTFPFQKLSLVTRDGTTIDIAGEELASALQYTNTEGYPPLMPFLQALEARTHAPPKLAVGRSILVTNGSQEGQAKAFDLLIQRNDHVLVENPTYSGALAALQPITDNLVGIATDQSGMIPDALEQTLKRASPRQFKVLYLIPTGQNPSGATMSTERRHRVYDIARRYNLIIMEDDPYWNLRYDDTPIPSFLSLDVDGRVLRFDSLSKVLSSGMRLGWCSGPAPLLERMTLHQQTSSLHASALSQAVVSALLNKWGQDGWDKHVASIRKFYGERRDLFMSFAKKHLTGLAEWHAPSAGFFVWFKLLCTQDAQALIQKDAVAAKVLMVPGQAFEPNNKPSPYVRAAFSVASPADQDEALRRLAALLKANTRN
eukprot:TRINITY_DN7923_c0_g1_i1.p1 TRINITY_DN7923_c0_g1~~TRINITY_DN7923_c0_g1_i1.p1  ORF type:complete len:432 (+),score=71.44 TRINITY_DN7923_c0_g1_i1:1713-3008(+)